MSNVIKKEMLYKDMSLGIIGESVSNTHCKVGDIVTFEAYGTIYVKPIVKLVGRTEGGIMGFGANHLNFDNMQRLLSYEDLTEDILRKLQEEIHGNSARDKYTIKEVAVEEMTLSEIEKELGRRIKVVAE